MYSPRVFFELAEITDRLRCIALSVSQRICVRLRHAERMASSQFDAAAFRLSGRGSFCAQAPHPVATGSQVVARQAPSAGVVGILTLACVAIGTRRRRLWPVCYSSCHVRNQAPITT